MIVYHGSTLCVENPLVGVCRDNLDFGKGFYLTDICEQAISWAKRVALLCTTNRTHTSINMN